MDGQNRTALFGRTPYGCLAVRPGDTAEQSILRREWEPVKTGQRDAGNVIFKKFNR
jgi:hypothetical protein